MHGRNQLQTNSDYSIGKTNNSVDINFVLMEERFSFIFYELHELVRHGRSSEVDAYLHKNPDACDLLMLSFQFKNESYSLLILASRNGHDKLVRTMLTRCPSEKRRIEEEGCVYNSKGQLVKNVTALWCALDQRHYKVAHSLIHLGGADLNHGPVHPLLFDAVARQRFDTVYFLVDNGFTDVNRTVSNDRHKVNSLFLCAIKGYTHIANYLIARGANVNEKHTNLQITPLHIAARTGNLLLAKSLCLAGAPTNIRSSTGVTPLMQAAQNGHLQLVDFLVEHNPSESTFNELELLAASFMMSDLGTTRSRSEKMIPLLQLSFKKRVLFNQAKTICRPIEAYDKQIECKSIDEFNSIQHDYDRLYVEALLIRERILLPQKSETLFKPLLKRAIVLAERAAFDRSLNLLLHTFYLYQQMDLRTCLHRFVWIFCRMISANTPIHGNQFLSACHLVFEPSQRKAQENDLKNALCLLALAAKVLEQPTMNDQDRHSIIQWIRDLCREQRKTPSGQTLLHLSVDSKTYDDISYRSVDVQHVLMFPNLGATKLLLCYGYRWIDLETVDQVQGNTALHVIAKSFSYGTNNDNKAIAELLIKSGAHIDCVNAYGKTPLELAIDDDIITLFKSKQVLSRLKCLCARVITKENLVYDQLWPIATPMNTFLRLHGGLKRKWSMSDSDDASFILDDDDNDDIILF